MPALSFFLTQNLFMTDIKTTIGMTFWRELFLNIAAVIFKNYYLLYSILDTDIVSQSEISNPYLTSLPIYFSPSLPTTHPPFLPPSLPPSLSLVTTNYD